MTKTRFIPSLVPFFAFFCLCWSPLASAQDKYEYMLRDQVFTSFPNAGSVDIAAQALFNQTVKLEMGEMKAREDKMEALKAKIDGHGHSAIDFLQRMQQLVEHMTPGQREAVFNASDDELAQMNLPEVNEISEIAREVRPEAEALFATLDGYIQDSLDLSMIITIDAIRNRILELDPKERNSDIRGLFAQMMKFKDLYLENKKEYGQGKDTKRTTAYGNFFKTAKDLFAAVDSPAMSKWKRIARKLGNLVKAGVWIAQRPDFAWDVLKTAAFAMTNPQPQGTTNPLLRSIMHVSRRLGEELDIPVEIEGAENLRLQGEDDEVFLITPSHRDMLKDQIALAHLQNDDMAPFAAAHVYPKLVVQRLGGNLGIIPVGPAAPTAPIDKAVQIATESKLRVFAIYPGGRLPEGLGYTMGARAKFFSEDGLVRSLEEKGFRVNIVAVAFRDNARLFGTRTLTRNEKISIKVAPVLRHETRQMITRIAGQKAIALMMRYGLIEDLVTNDELLWGQVRGSKLDAALSEYLLGDSECEGRLLTGPAKAAFN